MIHLKSHQFIHLYNSVRLVSKTVLHFCFFYSTLLDILLSLNERYHKLKWHSVTLYSVSVYKETFPPIYAVGGGSYRIIG